MLFSPSSRHERNWLLSQGREHGISGRDGREDKPKSSGDGCSVADMFISKWLRFSVRGSLGC